MKSHILNTIMSICILFIPFTRAENWVFRYEEGFGGEAYSLVYGSGAIYVAGYYHSLSSDEQFAVISLTPAGDIDWTYGYNGGWDNYQRAYALVLGADSNLYAAGKTRGGPTYEYCTVVSLNTSGGFNWVYRYTGSYHQMNSSTSVIYGADGNIYSTGYSVNFGYHPDFTVISLEPSGDPNWVYINSGPGGVVDNDCAYSAVYGADGNIYAAGVIDTGSAYEDFTVISFTHAGDTNWIYRYNGPADARDCAYSIVYGADNNIYAAGWSAGVNTSADIVVISLTTSGDTNWVYRYNGPGDANDIASSVIYGVDGNLYVAGYSAGNGTDDDFIVISLTTAGDANWVYRYNGPGNGDDRATSIVYGINGFLYAAGYSAGNGTGYDFTVIGLTRAGNTYSIYRYNGPGNDADFANDIIFGEDGNVYVAGKSDYYFTVISLPPHLGMEETNVTAVSKYNFGSTIIRGPLLLPTAKKWRVFDITGQIVEPEKIAPGIYFVEIDNEVVQKVVKIE